METLAGEDVELNTKLQEKFAQVLLRRLDEDDDGNITPKSNFETLAKVFTFFATPRSDRPANPLQYSEDRIQEAFDAAEAAVASSSDDVIVRETVAWDGDGIYLYAADADDYRDVDGSVTFELSASPGGTPLAGDITITNFTAGDVLDISGINLAPNNVRVIDNVTIDGNDLIVDLITDPGFFGLPVWAITFTDVDPDLVETLDPVDLVGSVQDAEWLII
jgi:hypothetical protein